MAERCRSNLAARRISDRGGRRTDRRIVISRVYRRVAIMIFVPAASHHASTVEMVAIDPQELQAAQERVRRCALRFDTPTFRYWQAAACPRAARKSATYRSPGPHIGSPGAVGRHTDTPNRVSSRAGAMNVQASEHCRRTAASRRRAQLCKFERHNDRPILHQ